MLVELKDYYPFGMEIPGLSTQAIKYQYNANRNRYNGKEIQAQEFKDSTGLTWDDYGARMYDPQIGRWMRLDPLTEGFYALTPYQYASNNPLTNIDLDGLEGTSAVSGNSSIQQKQSNSSAPEIWTAVKQSWTNFNNGNGSLYRGLDWFNRSFNPIGLIAHGASKLFTGKDLITRVEASRTEGLADIGTGALTFFGVGYLKFAGIGVSTAETSVWGFNQSLRGRIIENMLGGNLPKNFPVIDKLEDGVATSIKSIDLTAETYNKGNGLFNTLKGYIDKLNNFTRGRLSGVIVQEGENFTKKSIQVAIQPGKATIAQMEQIQQAFEYSKELNIEFDLNLVK